MRKFKMTAAAVLAAATVGVSIPAVPAYFSETGSISAVKAADEILQYYEYDDHIEISYCDRSAKEVVIPAEINGLPVTHIIHDAFSGCSELESVTIPDSVMHIGYWAFSGCSSLESITIPDSVTDIDSGAFGGCSSLTSITIPKNVTYIGNNFSNGCTALEEINVDENNQVYYSNDGVLYKNMEVNGYRYNSDSDSYEYVTEIYKTLLVCPESKRGSYTVADGTEIIEGYAFENCSKLTSINIPESVTDIEWGAFSGCTSLESVNIPESVKYISRETFTDCTSLKSITIPESVTYIGEEAFANCTSLKSMNISAGVEYIGHYFCDNCPELEEINVDSGNPLYYSHDGVLYKNKEVFEPIYDSATGPYEYEVKIRKTLLVYPEGKSGSYTVVDGTERIGGYAFENCSKLTSINIPASVTYIDYYFCDNCPELKEINVDRQNTVYYSYDGVLCKYSFEWYGNSGNYDSVLAYPQGKQGGYTVKNGTEGIANLAFENCEYLESVKIPESVERIGAGKLTISNGYEKINDDEDEYYHWINYYNRDYYFNGTIYGYNNTAAHIYATYSGYNFESMGDAPVYKTGDVNGDSLIDATDASAILVEYAYASTSVYSEFSNAQKTAGDIDGDGKVDSTDASKVLTFYSYLSTGGTIKDMNAWLESSGI